MLKDKLMLSRDIEVRKSPVHRYGVFAKNDIKSGTLIEESPFIVIYDDEYNARSVIHDYAFESGLEHTGCFSLGYVAVYNHSNDANAYHEVELKQEIVTIHTTKDIKKDEEIFIDYGQDWFEERELGKLVARMQDKYYNGEVTIEEIKKKLLDV